MIVHSMQMLAKYTQRVAIGQEVGIFAKRHIHVPLVSSSMIHKAADFGWLWYCGRNSSTKQNHDGKLWPQYEIKKQTW